ncbi:MAG TPA: Imm21 family immunity protein [Streptosporangiaceae bacterium]|nr:Imm21 family immunity protein [Streptosporangiaceae bacterium]
MENRWVTSLGGPLILIPQSACHLWNGVPRNYPDEEGDYGRACAVDDYIGLIDVGHAQALVLGDYPARTTFLPGPDILLREIAGNDDGEVLEATLKLLPAINWGSRLTWEITEPLILFDSAYDYPHVIAEQEEHLRVDLTPGRYTAEAAYLEIPDTAYLILIRLIPDIQRTS